MDRLMLSRLAYMAAVACVSFALPPPSAGAQQARPSINVPNFWDPSHRQEKPDTAQLRSIRFLTEAETPPFAFIGADGLATGFHVDLTRAICLELEISCTIQTLRWDLLLDGIDEGRGDAIIAAIAIDETAQERYDFSQRFLSRPARFVTRRDKDLPDVRPEDLVGLRVGVVEETAHEAFLRAFFPGTEIRPFDNAEAVRIALKTGEIDTLFGDGLNLSLWLNGAASERCCAFRGGPYFESRFFGEGFAIAVAPGNEDLRRAVNYALGRLHQTGTYAEVYLRYFPVTFY